MLFGYSFVSSTYLFYPSDRYLQLSVTLYTTSEERATLVPQTNQLTKSRSFKGWYPRVIMSGSAMLKAKIFVQLKPSVLDPQGKAVTNSLHNLGFDTVQETRISKYIEIRFDSEDKEQTGKQVEKICDSLLANPNTEAYHFELEEM